MTGRDQPTHQARPDGLPAAILAYFESAATMPAPQLCRLWPMDAKTLRRHVAAGNLVGRIKGLGRVHPRRVFTAADIVRFMNSIEAPPECQSSGSRTPGTTNSTSKGVVIAFPDRPNVSMKKRQRRSRPRKSPAPKNCSTE